jgi:hypothetical protein
MLGFIVAMVAPAARNALKLRKAEQGPCQRRRAGSARGLRCRYVNGWLTYHVRSGRRDRYPSHQALAQAVNPLTSRRVQICFNAAPIVSSLW